MATERERCEEIADAWMTDVHARKVLADVIQRARIEAHNDALEQAAVVADDFSADCFQSSEDATDTEIEEAHEEQAMVLGDCAGRIRALKIMGVPL
jgi:hypothetical protein